jgi:hypothetical protein
VNLYNGNLTLALPLGGSYPVGGPLSYGIVLQYNSGVWELVDAPACPPSTSPVDANPSSRSSLPVLRSGCQNSSLDRDTNIRQSPRSRRYQRPCEADRRDLAAGRTADG